MSTGNPYKFRRRLPADSDMFFGRKKEMERLMDMLSANPPQNVSIVGERRIGKSSMAFRVFHKIKVFSGLSPIRLNRMIKGPLRIVRQFLRNKLIGQF